MLVLEGLTQVNSDGRVAPRLAERWQWEADGRTLRVFLRPDVVFHDGRRFTSSHAADVLSAMARNPQNWSSYPSLAAVTRVAAVGDVELQIDLSEHSAFLPDDLAIPISGETALTGTGPFRVVKTDTSEGVLERFDRYYQGTPAIEQVIIRPFRELRTTWASLLRGEVDMVTDVPPNSVDFIRGDDINVVSWERWYQFMVAFNSTRPSLRSPSVRRALNIAIDREALIRNALKGTATPSSGPLWPKHWAYDRSMMPYGFDQALAKSMLDEAGFRMGSSSGRDGVPNARLRFTCLVPAGYSVLERIALDLQRQLYEVGVDVRFEALPPAEYRARLDAGKFEAVLVDMISGPSLGRPYLFWRSARNFKGLNVFGYENTEAEQLFQSLRTATNDAAVISMTRRLQRVLRDDPPALFLAWNHRARAVRREFDVHIEAGRDPLSTLWRWTPAKAPLYADAR